jgi:signal transduction histidine kinase
MGAVNQPGAGLRRVRVRTTAIAMVTVVAVLCLAGFAAARFFRQELVSQVDDRLREAGDFVEQARADDVPLPGEAAPDDFVQVVSPDGEVTYASPLLDGRPPVVTPGDAEIQEVETEDFGALRVITIDFGGGSTLLLGQDLNEVDDAVDSLVRVLLIGLPLLAAGLGIVVWWIVGRTLRPVEEAFARERRLVADASHELRSPLAGVRALLETEPDDPLERRQNRAEALAALSRLETASEDLLTLARSDRGAMEGTARPVDLDEIVLRQVELLEPTEAVEIGTETVSGGQVLGREADLERLVENLLTNALRHARSRIDVSVTEADGSVELVVGDDGPGVPVPDRERVFERFTRLDDARSAEHGGAGLGLSIVQAVAVAHGGSVAVEDAAAGGAAFHVRLPASTNGRT